MTLTIKDGRDRFYTFDTNRILLLTDDDDIITSSVHLETDGETSWDQPVMTDETTQSKYIEVPQEFLEGDYSRLVAYFYCKDDDGNYTYTKQVFRITERQEPEGYYISYTNRATWDSIKAYVDKWASDTKTDKEEADASAQRAKESETNAKTSETNAKTSETNAKTSETNASASEANALSYRNTTKTYMETTEGYMNNASTSATNASTSEANAKTSEDNAKQSETNAKSSEDVATKKAKEARDYRDEVAQMKSDVTVMKGEVSDMKSSVEETKKLADETEARAKSDIETLEGIESHVQNMESNVTSMQTDVTNSKEYVHERIDYLDGSLTSSVDNARQTVQGYIEEADESESRITALRTQLQTLVDKVESLSAQTVTETIIVDGSKVYKKSVTIKNGRPYCTLTEVTE